MARRSILTPARVEQPASIEEAPPAPAAQPRAGQAATSRRSKLHIGGYFDPKDPTLVAFQKLRVDLRKSQQEMLYEALCDFVGKHQAESAFRG